MIAQNWGYIIQYRIASPILISKIYTTSLRRTLPILGVRSVHLKIQTFQGFSRHHLVYEFQDMKHVSQGSYESNIEGSRHNIFYKLKLRLKKYSVGSSYSSIPFLPPILQKKTWRSALRRAWIESTTILLLFPVIVQKRQQNVLAFFFLLFSSNSFLSPLSSDNPYGVWE